MSLPSWAVAEVYEYDLGMSTACHNCGADLKEGATVYRDVESSVDWSRQGYPGLSSDLYCSADCVGPVPDCEWCGKPSDILTEVDDSDPSVGYRSVLTICPACQYKRSLPIGTPIYQPAPGDEDDEPWTDFGDELDAQDAGLWTGRSSRTPFTRLTIEDGPMPKDEEADHDAP